MRFKAFKIFMFIVALLCSIFLFFIVANKSAAEQLIRSDIHLNEHKYVGHVIKDEFISTLASTTSPRYT
jgi:hypothetical protein